jgi:protocatechuate 3,4-dioxygenase beta subunit
MKLVRCFLFLSVLFFSAPGLVQEPVIGGPCEGCDWVFVDMPENIFSSARIAQDNEAGEPLTLDGTAYSPTGQPARGVVIYAYHTNAEGMYPEGTTGHGSLRSWVKTDAQGRYRFDTIRPAAYPSREEPQHIHMHVIEPGKGTYYIDNMTFADDPLLKVRHQNQSNDARGGSGRSTPIRDASGTWHVQRDIYLGLNIPGY